MLWVLICTVHLPLCSYHVTYVFQSESSLAKWLGVRLRTKSLWVRVQLQSLNFRFRACFEQGVPWHSGNYRVWSQSETCTWHDKKSQKFWISSSFWYLQPIKLHDSFIIHFSRSLTLPVLFILESCIKTNTNFLVLPQKVLYRSLIKHFEEPQMSMK